MQDIKNIINDIKVRSEQLKLELNNVVLEKNELQSQVEKLKQNLQTKQTEVLELEEKVETLKNQPVAEVVENTSTNLDEQIDVLVREIDDCISRLKE